MRETRCVRAKLDVDGHPGEDLGGLERLCHVVDRARFETGRLAPDLVRSAHEKHRQLRKACVRPDGAGRLHSRPEVGPESRRDSATDSAGMAEDEWFDLFIHGVEKAASSAVRTWLSLRIAATGINRLMDLGLVREVTGREKYHIGNGSTAVKLIEAELELD